MTEIPIRRRGRPRSLIKKEVLTIRVSPSTKELWHRLVEEYVHVRKRFRDCSELFEAMIHAFNRCYV